MPELKLVAQFDQDGDHRLNAAERRAARAYLAQHPEPVTPKNPSVALTEDEPVALEAVKPGEKLTPAGVTTAGDLPVYESRALRTLFLEFEDADWEQQLTEFARTDVLLPARLTIDGQSFAGVGVHFHTASPTPALPAGYKRSLDLTLDFTTEGQTFQGQRTLQLKDARTDPTLLRATLYQRVAQDYIATPKTNFARVVLNGENWGIYVNVQPFDAVFTAQNFGSAEGTRWLASARGNLAYHGDDPAAYRDSYRLLTAENPAAWTRLAELCKLLDQTPISQLEAALKPYLDLDRTLRFLALETALIDQAGYGSAAGSYGLYLDPAGRFHLVPQETESSFRLLQTREFDNRPAGGGERGPSGNRGRGRGASGEKNVPGEIPVPTRSPNGTPSDFPKQGDTDLAMLLSYSFVNKVDRDNDGKITRDEWLDFARAWFVVVDEDQAGVVSRDQFITSVRNLVTPPSMRNPRAKQTFAGEDAAFSVGRDLFASMEQDPNSKVDRTEFVAAFGRWFTAWVDPKSARLTQESLQRGLNSVLTQSVFEADQLYVKKGAGAVRDESREGSEGGGRRRGGGGGGPNLGLTLPGGITLGGGRGSRGGGGNTRTIVTFNEELSPLAGLDDPNRPLISKLLAVPSFRARYFSYVRQIAEKWLVWERLGPIAQEAHALIAEDVKKETHKSVPYARFVQELDQETSEGGLRARELGEDVNLKAFITERRIYLQKNLPE